MWTCNFQIIVRHSEHCTLETSLQEDMTLFSYQQGGTNEVIEKVSELVTDEL